MQKDSQGFDTFIYFKYQDVVSNITIQKGNLNENCMTLTTRRIFVKRNRYHYAENEIRSWWNGFDIPWCSR